MKRFPWLLVVGALVTIVVLVILDVVLDRSSGSTSVIIGWGVVIGTWIREDLGARADRPPTSRAREGIISIALIFFFVGLGLLLPYLIRLLFQRTEPEEPAVPLLGAASIVLGLLIMIPLIVGSLRRRRKNVESS